MLPKRKFIKKRHRKQEQETDLPVTQPTTLLERLHSGEPTLIEEALAYISSLCVLADTPELLPLLAELVAILHKGPTAAVYQCLYALANLIELDGTIVPQLLQLGLAKSLVQLNSGDLQLLKPILTLMTELHGLLPEELCYLQSGVEQSLSVAHLDSPSKEQVLTYLMRIGSSSLQQDMYEKVYYIFKNQHQLRIRSLCAAVLMRNIPARSRASKDLLEYCQELFCDIDLEKEHHNNILHAKPTPKHKEGEKDAMEQEEEELPASHPNLETFHDAVQGVETMLEVVLTLLEETDPEEEEADEEDEEGGEWEKDPMETEEEFSQSFINFFTEKIDYVYRNTMLTFKEGQNIIHLALRLLTSCKSVDKSTLGVAVVGCFDNMFQVKPPAQIQEQILVVGLHLLMKCPLPMQARSLVLSLGESVLKVSSVHKGCWMRLLEIYSVQFNPEKGAVSQQENMRAGAILKNLLINIPELSLEEWRAQAIDTLFDVFSNEDFDVYLVQLQMLPLLEKVLQHVGGGKKKKKFVRLVVSDVQRFLDYKRKMIKF